MAQLDRPDRPKLTATVAGILRNLLLIESLLAENSKIPLKKIHPLLRAILVVSIYQLLFDDTIPDHAVIHAAVSLCLTHHKSYANAILRIITRNRDYLLSASIPALPPSLRHSFPQALFFHLQATFPASVLNDYMAYLNTDPVFHSVPMEHYPLIDSPMPADAIKNRFLDQLHASCQVQKLNHDELRLHRFLVQNISSQFISYFSASLQPRTILDLCAAPGSKSVMIALMAQKIRIFANDISLSRLKRLVQRKQLHEALFDRIAVCCGDALNPPFSNHFDLVLLDAPCSAFGTIRKHPDRRYNGSVERITELSRRQHHMLVTALTQFSKAHLLYSVCTFTQAETVQLIEKVIAEARVDSTAFQRAQQRLISALSDLGIPYQQSRFGVFILPDKNLNTDLFFISLFPPSE